MTEREFGNFSQWPLKELIAKERSFTVGDSRGAELQAEINRRYAKRNQRYSLVNVISTVVIAFGTFAGIVYGLDRGIYVGSYTYMAAVKDPFGSSAETQYVFKRCRYLFVSGLTEKGSHGGLIYASGGQNIGDAGLLYCRFFGE